MPRIAVVDDIRKEGEDLAVLLNNRVRSEGWECLYTLPFDDPDEYNAWIQENDIWALVLDWKLSGVGRAPGERGVSYTAERVVGTVRRRTPDFPIYIVTTYAPTAEGEDWLADVETFDSRIDFVRALDVLAPRILRATARFRQAHKATLATISSLATKAAQGRLTDEERTTLVAARSSLHLDAGIVPEQTLGVIEEAEAAQREIDTTIEAIRSKLEGSEK